MEVRHDHPAAMDPGELESQCELVFTRRAGPGGQHRNKVSTAVVLVHRPSGVRAEASERRSQIENRRVALFRLRLKLALEVRMPMTAEHAPSALWQSRCVNGRVAVSPDHADYPALLAEALDVLAAADADVRQAAQTLRCTASQLVKLLKREPAALAAVNQKRRDCGLRPLA